MTTLGYLFAPEASGAINYEIFFPAHFKPIFRVLNAVTLLLCQLANQTIDNSLVEFGCFCCNKSKVFKTLFLHYIVFCFNN